MGIVPLTYNKQEKIFMVEIMECKNYTSHTIAVQQLVI